MTIICLYKMADHVYTAFFAPAYAGNHIEDAVMNMSNSSVEDYNIKVFDSYDEANRYAFEKCFGPTAYELSYGKKNL